MNTVESKMYDAAKGNRAYTAQQCAAITKEVALGFLEWFLSDVVSVKALELPKDALKDHNTLYNHYINNVLK